MTDTTKTTAAPKASKPRVNRTPAQKAQDLLDAAKARWDRADTAAGKATQAAKDAEAAKQAANDELGAANAAVKYAEQHPDLPGSVNIGTVTVDIPVNVAPGGAK